VRPERVLEAPFMRGDDEGCTQLVAWSSGGLLVGLDKRVFLWNNATIGATRVTALQEDREAYINSLGWSSHLSTLAMLASDGIVSLVDPNRGKTQVDLGPSVFGTEVESMCLVDGLLAVGRADGFVTLFDRRTPSLGSSSMRAHSGGVSRISVSVDGNNIATSGERNVMVWDRRYMGTANAQPLWSKRGLLRTIKVGLIFYFTVESHQPVLGVCLVPLAYRHSSNGRRS
jgi:WD40 repeat protein